MLLMPIMPKLCRHIRHKPISHAESDIPSKFGANLRFRQVNRALIQLPSQSTDGGGKISTSPTDVIGKSTTLH